MLRLLLSSGFVVAVLTTKAPPAPTLHYSPEANVGHRPCRLPIQVAGIDLATVDVGPAFPQWVPVQGEDHFMLEGAVMAGPDPWNGPRMAVEDMPAYHFTHDVNFKIRPDPTPDGRFTDLLGVQVYADGRKVQQEGIGIEWELGLGADNAGNIATEQNRRGESHGFFTAGHKRGEAIWAMPTEGDRVHVEGRWVWDRGHPPADTEIHPARLLAVMRALPDSQGGKDASRCDLFASGDGGAPWNNLPDMPPYVQRVAMSERDYSFELRHLVRPPAPLARLEWAVETRPGDTFGAPLGITQVATDGVRVAIPWNSARIPDEAVLARTIRLTWDRPAAEPSVRTFRVRLESVEIRKTRDFGDGAFRLFADVGGTWLFLNELIAGDDILKQGLGSVAAGQIFKLDRAIDVRVPEDGRFRVATSGWEADGVNEYFGHQVDMNRPCDEDLRKIITEPLATILWFGGRDDIIGWVRSYFDASNGFGVGAHEDRAKGKVGRQRSAEEEEADVWLGEDPDPNDSYRLRYAIEQVPTVQAR